MRGQWTVQAGGARVGGRVCHRDLTGASSVVWTLRVCNREVMSGGYDTKAGNWRQRGVGCIPGSDTRS